MKRETKTHIEIVAPILEMGDAMQYSTMVQVDDAFLREVTDGDIQPQFVVSVIEEQQSRKKVNYDATALELIADQVNKKRPTGYLGHIPDSERDSALPMPQVLWLGAKVLKNLGDKAKMITKGYLIPEGSAKSLIKRHVIKTVSWSGDGKMIPGKNGGWDLIEFDLESIDFARKGREGMPGQSLAIVTEMGDELDKPSKGGKRRMARDRDDDDTQDYERIVGGLTPTEIKTLNPGVYKVIYEMGKDEGAGDVTKAVEDKTAELTTAHEAAIAAMPERTIVERLRELFKLDKIEDITDNVTALIEQLDKAGKEVVRAWFNDEILAKKIPNEKARQLVSRLIPVTEMAGDYRSDAGIEKIKQQLAEKADELVEGDEAIKTLISEMGSGRGGLRLATDTGGVRNDDRGGNNNDPEIRDANGNLLKSTSRMSLETVSAG